MFKKILVGLVICFLGVSLSAGIATAKDKDKDLGGKIFKKMYIALEEKEELGLSDSQFDRILDLKVATKKDYIMKKAEIKTTLLDLKVELMKDQIDMEKVNSLIDKIDLYYHHYELI